MGDDLSIFIDIYRLSLVIQIDDHPWMMIPDEFSMAQGQHLFEAGWNSSHQRATGGLWAAPDMLQGSVGTMKVEVDMRVFLDLHHHTDTF